MSGALSGQYKESDFVRDFQGGHAGFTVQFFTWKEVANNRQIFLFFWPPTSPRRFDSVFKCASDLNKLHFCLLQFYDEFEGDCLSRASQ